ncbi:hypothetical protein QBC44DRAFT_369021 [Cladorrhinum sp. PSN332]|nr:hypothetical protein QBC44DRAFT_369021 [Cladorrhinum sp. PSN332]
MCPQNPKCPISSAHGRGKAHQQVNKTTKKTPAIAKRQTSCTSRANRARLQEAVIKSSRAWWGSAALRNPNDTLPRKLPGLGPSDKLSDDLDLVRDLLARALTENAIWKPLLTLLELELPGPSNFNNNTTTTIIGSSEEQSTLKSRVGAQMAAIVFHPIWSRFPDVDKTRKLIADTIIAPCVAQCEYDLVTMLLGYGADITYTSGGLGYPSALECAVQGVAFREARAEMLFMLLNDPKGSRQMQTVPQETFEKISTYWSSAQGREAARTIIDSRRTEQESNL